LPEIGNPVNAILSVQMGNAPHRDKVGNRQTALDGLVQVRQSANSLAFANSDTTANGKCRWLSPIETKCRFTIGLGPLAFPDQ